MTAGLMRRRRRPRVPDVAALVDTGPTRSLTTTAATVLGGADLRGPSSTGPSPPALYMMMNCVLASWRRGRMLARCSSALCASSWTRGLRAGCVTSSPPIASDVTYLHKLAYIMYASRLVVWLSPVHHSFGTAYQRPCAVRTLNSDKRQLKTDRFRVAEITDGASVTVFIMFRV